MWRGGPPSVFRRSSNSFQSCSNPHQLLQNRPSHSKEQNPLNKSSKNSPKRGHVRWKAMAVFCVHTAGFLKLHFSPPNFFYSLFGLFQDTLDLSNYITKTLKVCTFHFSLETSEKLSFGPPSGNFRKLHLGPFARFDLKLICFNPKSLKGCSIHRNLVLKALRWHFGRFLRRFGFSALLTTVPKTVPDFSSFDS